MDAEQAETYLRLAAESALRSADRAAGVEAASLRVVRAVAEAFQGVGAVPAEVAEHVVDGLQAAIVVRSDATAASGRWPLPGAGRPSRQRPGRPWVGGVRPLAGGAPLRVTAVGRRLTAGREESDIGIYLLALASSPRETVLSSVIRLLRPGQGAPFNLDAVDAAGRAYQLRFTGGGADGAWLTGEFLVIPRPPDGTAWLDISYGLRTVRVDLPSSGDGDPEPAPPAVATVTQVSLSPGEAYLRSQADGWLSMSMPQEVGDLAMAVPALTAIGALPASSDLPAKIAALARRERSGLPDHWADAIAVSDPGAAPPARRLAAAHLSVTLPAVDGHTVVLTGLTAGAWSTLHGMLLGGEAPADVHPACWIRDWTDGTAGPWRPVSMGPWDWQLRAQLGGIRFYATLSLAFPSAASCAEVLVTGRTAEARTMVPLTWWLH
jgi:hypothetical protein